LILVKVIKDKYDLTVIGDSLYSWSTNWGYPDLFLSPDKGESWTPLSEAPLPNNFESLSFKNHLYSKSSKNRIFVYTESDTFEFVDEDFNKARVNAYSVADDKIWFCPNVISYYDLKTSEWHEINSFPHTFEGFGGSIACDDNGWVVVQNPIFRDRIFLSQNRGTTWDARWISNNGIWQKVMLHNGCIYVSNYNSNMVKSTDGGLTWQNAAPLTNSDHRYSNRILFENIITDFKDKSFYPGNDYCVSSDGGSNWDVIEIDFDILKITEINSELYGLARNNFIDSVDHSFIVKSTDGIEWQGIAYEENWSEVTTLFGYENEVYVVASYHGPIYGTYLERYRNGEWEKVQEIKHYNLQGFNYKDELFLFYEGLYKVKKEIDLPETKPITTQLSIFPNPTQDRISISSPCSDNESKLLISSLDGKIVLEQKMQSFESTKSIDLSGFIQESGVYLLSVNCSGEVHTEKLVFVSETK